MESADDIHVPDVALVLPFGKYRGLSIDDILEADDEYVRWLTRQSWFQERFAYLQTYIRRMCSSTVNGVNTVNAVNAVNAVNSINGVNTRGNPVRNRMQTLFLRPDFLSAFADALVFAQRATSAHDDTAIPDAADAVHDFLETLLCTDGRKLHERWEDDGATLVVELGWNNRNSSLRTYGAYIRKRLVLQVSGVTRCVVTQFETNDAYDVQVQIDAWRPGGTYDYPDRSDAVQAWERRHALVHVQDCGQGLVLGRWSVILRPLVGVDYTALIRRAHDKPRDGSRVAILIGRYECDDVTSRQELRQLFGNDGVTLVFLDDLPSHHSQHVWKLQ